MPLSDDDIREILRLIDESDAEELRVETESFSLHLVRGNTARSPAGAPAASRAAAEVRPDGATDERLAIAAPMIGTFYRAPEPGAAPFVDVGTHVEPDTTVCLIEVMKMMNPVPAGISGTIVEVCVENAEPVEYGAPLFRVQPDGRAP
jgi:acetyl-CoA carboxylase biotin carboxyl carrier protein